MSATRQPVIKALDDSAEGKATLTGGEDLTDFIDEPSLTNEINRAASRNRAETRSFRQYQKKVIEAAGVKNTHLIRQLASNICGTIARLPDVPDNDEKFEDDRGRETTEWDEQIKLSARQAEELMQTEVVLTTSARKLATAALELRAQDPDGKKGIAWVNDQREDEAGVLDA